MTMGTAMRTRVGARVLVLAALLCALRPGRAGGTELTFELPDSARQCFHQELQRGLKFTLDYQVPPCLGSSAWALLPAPCPCLCPCPCHCRAPLSPSRAPCKPQLPPSCTRRRSEP